MKHGELLLADDNAIKIQSDIICSLCRLMPLHFQFANNSPAKSRWKSLFVRKSCTQTEALHLSVPQT